MRQFHIVNLYSALDILRGQFVETSSTMTNFDSFEFHPKYLTNGEDARYHFWHGKEGDLKPWIRVVLHCRRQIDEVKIKNSTQYLA